MPRESVAEGTLIFPFDEEGWRKRDEAEAPMEMDKEEAIEFFFYFLIFFLPPIFYTYSSVESLSCAVATTVILANAPNQNMPRVTKWILKPNNCLINSLRLSL